MLWSLVQHMSCRHTTNTVTQFCAHTHQPMFPLHCFCPHLPYSWQHLFWALIGWEERAKRRHHPSPIPVFHEHWYITSWPHCCTLIFPPSRLINTSTNTLRTHCYKYATLTSSARLSCCPAHCHRENFEIINHLSEECPLSRLCRWKGLSYAQTQTFFYTANAVLAAKNTCEFFTLYTSRILHFSCMLSV